MIPNTKTERSPLTNFAAGGMYDVFCDPRGSAWYPLDDDGMIPVSNCW